jgi:hypothetical protein
MEYNFICTYMNIDVNIVVDMLFKVRFLKLNKLYIASRSAPPQLNILGARLLRHYQNKRRHIYEDMKFYPHCKLYSTVSVIDQVSHPYYTTCTLNA